MGKQFFLKETGLGGRIFVELVSFEGRLEIVTNNNYIIVIKFWCNFY